MLDFLNACLAAKLAGRDGRISALGCGRNAVVRLGIAVALVAVVVGALNREASGTALPLAIEVAGPVGWGAG